MKISQVVEQGLVERDVNFNHLGYVDSASNGVLAYADTLRYLNLAKQNPNLVALITTPKLRESASQFFGLVVVDNPRNLFYKIHQYFIDNKCYKMIFEAGVGDGCEIHPTAIVSPNCCIGNNVKIGEYAVIKDAVLIESNVTIEAGVKVGVDGILYEKLPGRGVNLIPHGGYVNIQEGAVIMTNATIVRSIHDTDATTIGKGALIGLGTIVGHEAKVHDAAVISNLCVLARRSEVGKNAFLGTNVTVKENVTIGSNAQVMAGSVVINDVPNNTNVSGNFATNHKSRMLEYFRNKKDNK